MGYTDCASKKMRHACGLPFARASPATPGDPCSPRVAWQRLARGFAAERSDGVQTNQPHCGIGAPCHLPENIMVLEASPVCFSLQQGSDVLFYLSAA